MKTTQKTSKFARRSVPGWELMLDAKQTAKKLKITTAYLYLKRSRGDAPRAVKSGRSLRWSRQAIAQYLLERKS